MRKSCILSSFCLLILAPFAAVSAQATMYTFHPTPSDLGDLDHGYYYTWGINWSIPNGQQITEASLFIDNINDWKVESDDILYIHLLDRPSLGTRQYTDHEGGGDAFRGQGVLLTTYNDKGTGSNPSEDWTYHFTASQIETLGSYVSDGRFGFGLDPDCHYFNDGITLTIATQAGQLHVPNPEPSTILFCVATLGYLAHSRGRRRPLAVNAA